MTRVQVWAVGLLAAAVLAAYGWATVLMVLAGG